MDEKKWAMVELMGHRKFAGSIERGQMLVITIPETPNNPQFIKEFGWGSVYGITPCSESVARRAAEVLLHNGYWPYGEGVAIPVFDDHGLNMVSDPMDEIDLEKARSGELLEEWEEERRRLATAEANSPDFPF